MISFPPDTIVSGNTAAMNPDLIGSFDSAFSLIQSRGGAAINETVPGSDILNKDPLLGPLQNNGGATQTMLPSPSSPAINKGKAFALSTDQRLFPRPVAFPGVANSGAAGADGSDIGAAELQVPLAVTNAASGVAGSGATLNGSVNPENVAPTTTSSTARRRPTAPARPARAPVRMAWLTWYRPRSRA